ncbi:MAG: hypothetical protein ACPG19_12060 [Saprospiraceae bacterium]
MVNNKLVSMFETFSKYELNRFRKYLISPFFNENEKIVLLFDLLDEHLRNNLEQIQKKEDWYDFARLAWTKIYERKAYDDVKFRRLCSDLTKLGQDFIGYKEYELQPLTQYNHTLTALNERNLNKHFLAVERKARTVDKKERYRNAGSFLENFRLEYERHNYLERNAARHSFQGNQVQADFYLDCYYWSNKLKMHSESLNNRTILNIDADINLINDLLEQVQGSRLIKVPAIAIYYHIIMTFQGEDTEKHFTELITLIEKHGHQFPQGELRSIYVFAQNYCIRKINTGQLMYYEQLFSIYKALLEREIIFNKKELSSSNYKNIVTVGLFVKQFDWIEEFIYKYNQKLPKAYRNSSLNYNLANLFFNKAEYDKVIEQLQQMEYKDAFDGLSSRWLLLKTYYELSEINAFEALTDSFSIFIRRNKSLSDRNKGKYLNAVRFISKIMKISYSGERAYDNLHRQLLEAKVIIDKRWLLKKLENIKK